MSSPRSRRAVLKSLLGGSSLLALSPTVPVFLGATARASRANLDERETVLVVVQLAGGNDGLNTIVPHGDDLYAKSRPTLRLPSSKLHRIDSLLGFHPRMDAFARLHAEGLLSVVQGVGYPNPNGGHFESMHIWQTADLSTRGQTGWIGRTVDRYAGDRLHDSPAAFVGQIRPPFALNAERAILPTIRALDDGLIHEPGKPGSADLGDRLALASAPRGKGPFLDFLQKTTLSAYHRGKAIEQAATAAASLGEGDYPPLSLARSLRLAARLIRANVGLRIIYTELGGEEPGGFDNHANQADNHAALLHQLSESVAAFARDLKRDGLLDHVLLMTFSEFGRTVRENGRRGTDHGSAAPLFLAGGKVACGLIGRHPDLSELEGGGLKHHTDFRSVYATVLERWLGLDSEPVLGAKFKGLDLLQS